ncbi:MAG: hypothetical protein ABIR68_05020 [Ilumatobacteraceae bacterium]
MNEGPPTLTALPGSFGTTREGLRTLACYVIAPARKAIEGRIGLRPTGDGFATPVLPDGTRIAVRGDELRRGDDASRITTLRAAAAQLGVTLSADPGVGHDLPPFDPTVALDVDAVASFALGAWYSFGQSIIERLATAGGGSRTWTETQLWPEHFDLATAVTLANGAQANVGFSAGDGYHTDPYVYVGPHDMSTISGDWWNAPFGAVRGYESLRPAIDASDAAAEFVEHGLGLLSD